MYINFFFSHFDFLNPYKQYKLLLNGTSLIVCVLTLFMVLRRSSHLEERTAAADREGLEGTAGGGTSSNSL